MDTFWTMLAAFIGAAVGTLIVFAVAIWVHLNPSKGAAEAVDNEPNEGDMLAVVAEYGDQYVGLPENVKLALLDYTLARLEANGNTPVPAREILMDFARWHGVPALTFGQLRNDPPPMPDADVDWASVQEA